MEHRDSRTADLATRGLEATGRTRMSDFIDLERQFHELTDQELDDPDALLARSEYLPDSTTGWPELLGHHRIVLFAEAGAGKTAEMRQQARRLAAEGRFAFFVALEDLDSRSIDDALETEADEMRFQEWRTDPDAPAWFFRPPSPRPDRVDGGLDAVRCAGNSLATARGEHHREVARRP